MTMRPGVVSSTSVFCGSVPDGSAVCFASLMSVSFPLKRLLRNGSLLDVVELGEIAGQIGVALLLDALLIGPVAARRAFAVAAVERIDHVHARHHAAERRKSHAVERAVVGEVDE